MKRVISSLLGLLLAVSLAKASGIVDDDGNGWWVLKNNNSYATHFKVSFNRISSGQEQTGYLDVEHDDVAKICQKEIFTKPTIVWESKAR
jgi:hypothetical protein